MTLGSDLLGWLLFFLAMSIAGSRRFFRRRCSRHRRRFVPPIAAKRFRAAPVRRSGGRAKPPWVREAVLDLYTEGTVSCRINRLYAAGGMTVGKTWVGEVLTRYHYESAGVRRAARNRIPRPLPANRRWGLDCTGKADSLGNIHAILGIVDHGTRLNLALAPLATANAWTILGHLFLAIGRFGKPQRLRSDNAAVFHSRLFQTVLKATRIHHEFSEPGKPWQNGRIERLFLTLKEQLNKIVPTDGAALGSLLAEFMFWYNAVRPHQHLYGLTPWEAWTGTDPYRLPPREMSRFVGWDGQLCGLVLRR